MSFQFKDYAKYYDLFYSKKNYRLECEFILRLFRKFGARQPRDILDFGCGSGRHAEWMAKKGILVDGIDLSAQMIRIANAKKRMLVKDVSRNLHFEVGNIGRIRKHRTYDGVVSLFHVMSYQKSNSDLVRAFKNARRHLNSGGLFIFDFWYGPAVVSDPPVLRVARYEDRKASVIRIAEPDIDSRRNLVRVNYTWFGGRPGSGIFKKMQETHTMRYLFINELESIALQSGFAVVHAGQWMNLSAPSPSNWGAYLVCRA